MNQENELQPTSLYSHLASNGEIFIIANDIPFGSWVDVARFKAELQRLKETSGILVLSWDDDSAEDGSPQKILEDLVRSYELDVRVGERHPAVTGYNRSFAKSLWNAVDLAKHDIEGTSARLDNARYWLTQNKPGTSDFSFWTEESVRLAKQLDYAKMAYNKLNDLELELTRDPEGGEN
jgi:hypothetical protein